MQVLFSTCKRGTTFDEKWELTFSDEFTDTVLNRNVWKTEFEWGYPEDQQKYIDSAFTIKDGILHIITKRDTVIGKVQNNYNHLFYFSSGMIQSSKSFSQKYGYVEMRCKVPSGLGFWSSFWMLGAKSWPPEVDIFEISGLRPNKMSVSNHFKSSKGKEMQNGTSINGPDFSQDFHNFGLEWNVKKLIWYIDGVKVYETDYGIPQSEMFLVLSISLGGGVFSGKANNTTPLPNSCDVDYIRVYKNK